MKGIIFPKGRVGERRVARILRRLHFELRKAEPQATVVVRLPEIPDFVDAEQADRDAEKLGQILPDAVIDRFCYVKGRFLAPEPYGSIP